MRIQSVETPTAAQWRARAERARRFLWAVGEVDARRLDEYAAECEAEACRLEGRREGPGAADGYLPPDFLSDAARFAPAGSPGLPR